MKNRKQFERKILQDLAGKPYTDYGYEAGGAPIYGYDYQDQLTAKHNALLELFAEVLPPSINSFELVPSPQECNYRVKMEYVISDGKLGMRKSRQFTEVVNLFSTPLANDKTLQKVRKLYRLAKDLGIPDFNLKSSTGFLRYFVVKELAANQLMLNIITTDDSRSEQISALAELAIELKFNSVNWLKVPKHEDHTNGTKIKNWGKPYLIMKLNGIKYFVGPLTFTQNNLAGFKQILGFITPYLKDSQRVLDFIQRYWHNWPSICAYASGGHWCRRSGR